MRAQRRLESGGMIRAKGMGDMNEAQVFSQRPAPGRPREPRPVPEGACLS